MVEINGRTWCKVDEAPPVLKGIVKRDAVYRLIKQGKITHLRLSAKALFVSPDFLDELVREPVAA